MKKIITLTLLCLFLSGCKVDNSLYKMWDLEKDVGYSFSLRNKITGAERYYKIWRISEEEYNSLMGE